LSFFYDYGFLSIHTPLRNKRNVLHWHVE
jgi:hypothetical protein